jgi:hypothetical protein
MQFGLNDCNGRFNAQEMSCDVSGSHTGVAEESSFLGFYDI